MYGARVLLMQEGEFKEFVGTGQETDWVEAMQNIIVYGMQAPCSG
jgi:hypothetical protein